jgi:hypothetical protein
VLAKAAEAKAAGEFKSGEDARPGPGRGNSKTVDPDSGPPFTEPKRDVKKKKEDSTRGKLADELGSIPALPGGKVRQIVFIVHPKGRAIVSPNGFHSKVKALSAMPCGQFIPHRQMRYEPICLGAINSAP